MDGKNFAIGILSTTAVVLLVGLFVLHDPGRQAFAEGMTIVGSEFALSVGAVTKNDEDLIYVIDGPGEKLIVYRFDPGKKQILLVQGLSLKEMRAKSGSTNQPDPKTSTTPKKRP